LRVLEAILDAKLGVALPVGAVHGLQVKVLELEVGKALGLGAGLGEYQLELMALAQYPLAAGFGAHAYPVEAGRRVAGAIGFDGHLEAELVKGFDEGFVELKERLASGAYHVGRAGAGRGPEARYLEGQLIGCIAAAIGAVDAAKIGIAKLADGRAAIFFAAAPEVAARKAAEHGGAAGLGALALKGVIDFFDQIYRHAKRNLACKDRAFARIC